jgi:RND family efflux transporter MFP subunit
MPLHLPRKKIVVVLIVLGLGFGGMYLLGALKSAPSQVPDGEQVVHAVGMRVSPQTVRVELTGFGTARVVRRSIIGAEVGGRIAALNPAVANGNWIAEGEWLLQIDPADYESRVRQIEAEAEALVSQIDQLRAEAKNLDKRLEVARRNRDLAEREYERFRKLVEEEKVEARSRMDSVERDLTRQQESVLALENQKNLNPIQIRQQQARLESVRAQLAVARLDLQKTRILAPFAGHIENKQVEVGQLIQPSAPVLTLADDAALEITVPLESGDAARWLDLAAGGPTEHWFTRLPDSVALVRWPEVPERGAWRGRIDRVASYDERTRTVSVVVRIEGAQPVTENAASNGESSAGNFPLVDGMFCQVTIPGRSLAGIFRVPQTALQEDGSVLVVEDGRMRSRPVHVARLQGDEAWIDRGLQNDDLVLTRRPGQVIEGLRVNVQPAVGGREQPPAQPELALGSAAATRQSSPSLSPAVPPEARP